MECNGMSCHFVTPSPVWYWSNRNDSTNSIGVAFPQGAPRKQQGIAAVQYPYNITSNASSGQILQATSGNWRGFCWQVTASATIASGPTDSTRTTENRYRRALIGEMCRFPRWLPPLNKCDAWWIYWCRNQENDAGWRYWMTSRRRRNSYKNLNNIAVYNRCNNLVFDYYHLYGRQH